MPLGILNDVYLDQVPGTVALVHKRKAQSGLNEVILVPKPSNDPLDPLNWPRWRKECIFWVLALGGALGSSTGHLLNPGFVELSKEWGVSVNAFKEGVGNGRSFSTIDKNNTKLLIIRIMCSFCPWVSPLAVKYGRRPVYLTAALLLFFGTIWSGLSQGLQSFTGSRIIQGFGVAAFESVMTASIGDIYFVSVFSRVHQRGLRTAIWSFGLTAGVNVAPIVNGYVISSPRFISALFGILCLLVIFLVPETAYKRQHRYAIDSSGASELVPRKAPSIEASNLKNEFEEVAKSSLGEKDPANTFIFEAHDDIQIHTPRHDIKQLLPWSGYKDEKSLFKIFLRPFPFLLSPVVFYGVFIFGLTFIWLILLSIITSTVFALPPYHFNTRQVGLVSIGPMVGSLIGTIISGPLCDLVTTAFAKRNKGIYEPEARLLLIIPMFIFQVGGYIGWAILASKGAHWIGPVSMYTIINLGQSIGNTAAIAYIIDVHRENAAECFAIINFVKDVVLYGFAQFANSWVAEMGVLRVFGVLAGMSGFCMLTTIPMYIYGKRARSFVARHPQ
ncbi:hypothetical protein M422DRAFT_49621 [Sphaerobolus stellatus SS14]|uniref:Major facilitator superfamily (MFS) profile domain-containing protein n=1 Tax=Sphaerobolus stellatus (strain SS14) TaxID=990650 RepID=A0A0C9VNX8_SPHS4|nr:hypothetical protein M422DRAFT_49621 [Sphaerobolus stellatus SS14]